MIMGRGRLMRRVQAKRTLWIWIRRVWKKPEWCIIIMKITTI